MNLPSSASSSALSVCYYSICLGGKEQKYSIMSSVVSVSCVCSASRLWIQIQCYMLLKSHDGTRGNIYFSLWEQLQKTSLWFGAQSMSSTWPFLSITRLYEMPSWVATILAGKRGKAEQGDQEYGDETCLSVPMGQGEIEGLPLGMHFKSWCIFSTLSFLPAALICKQDLNQPKQMNWTMTDV